MNVVLGAGASVAGILDDEAGAVELALSLEGESWKVKPFFATDFTVPSAGLSAAYVGETVELGAFLGKTFNKTSNFFTGFTFGLTLHESDLVKVAPEASLQLSHVSAQPPEEPETPPEHGYETSYCPEGGAGGIFSNDQGEGGCANRTFPTRHAGSVLPEEGLGVESGIALKMELFLIPDRLSMELGLGLTLGLAPEVSGVSMLATAGILYTFP